MKTEPVLPIAIVCSDIHLTLKQPVCRDDKDWMETQKSYLDQVTELSYTFGDKYKYRIGKWLPVIIAGDIFDKWNPPPELLSFAFRNLPPKVFAVPGQHDLPNHRMDDMHKSGYGVLVDAERIANVSSYINFPWQTYVMKGFGWNQEVKVADTVKPGMLKIAILHRFVWTEGFGYTGAPKSHHMSGLPSELGSYDVAIFGDNHKGFESRHGNCFIYNCGGFIRRKSDEIKYQPHVGILYENGVIKKHYLDTSIDRFHKNAKKREAEESAFDMTNFLEELENLGDQACDFREAVRQALRKKNVPKAVQSLTLAALES